MCNGRKSYLTCKPVNYVLLFFIKWRTKGNSCSHLWTSRAHVSDAKKGANRVLLLKFNVFAKITQHHLVAYWSGFLTSNGYLLARLKDLLINKHFLKPGIAN